MKVLNFIIKKWKNDPKKKNRVYPYYDIELIAYNAFRFDIWVLLSKLTQLF